MNHPIRSACLVCALCCLLLVGCSPFDAKVSGLVTYDDAPLDHGMVSYYPMAGGPTSYGNIQSDGTYVLQTGNRSGIDAGDYRVTVNCVKQIPPEREGDPPGFRPLIPVKYKSADSSELQFEVKKGRNQIDIALSSK